MNKTKVLAHEMLTAPCGVLCKNCEVFNDYYGKDPRKFKFLVYLLRPFFKITTYFSKEQAVKYAILLRILTIPKDQSLCRGCRQEKGLIPVLGNKKNCPFYSCCEEKNLHNCSQCDSFPCQLFYPRRDLANLTPHNTKLINCLTIKKYGLEKWATDHAELIDKIYADSSIPIDIQALNINHN